MLQDVLWTVVAKEGAKSMRNWARRCGGIGLLAVFVMFGTGCASKETQYHSESAVDIHAALQLNGEAEQFTRLQAIAARPYLRNSDQVMLVDETLGSGLSPAQKADVLVTLVKNPSVSVAAKARLLEQLAGGALPEPEQQMVLREMVDNPAGRLYADGDAPVPVIDAVRQPAPITSSEPAAQATPTAEATLPAAEPQLEPITITPLPVK
jgi:hypothetical protein